MGIIIKQSTYHIHQAERTVQEHDACKPSLLGSPKLNIYTIYISHLIIAYPLHQIILLTTFDLFKDV